MSEEIFVTFTQDRRRVEVVKGEFCHFAKFYHLRGNKYNAVPCYIYKVTRIPNTDVFITPDGNGYKSDRVINYICQYSVPRGYVFVPGYAVDETGGFPEKIEKDKLVDMLVKGLFEASEMVDELRHALDFFKLMYPKHFEGSTLKSV